jgi:Na+-transporting methylmalonyl-CoA/oxaloacetate decarboxylase beta subunit
LGFVAISLNTIISFLFGKLLVLLSHGKANPILFLVGIIPAPLPGELVAYIVQKNNGGDNIIESALAINSGVQLIYVLLGCIFFALAMNLVG